MGKGPIRNRDIVVKSQFNIHGSRGKNVGHFISDYVARNAATDASLAWLPPTDRPPVPGDGVAFTLDATAISKQETLDLADHVQEIFERGNRAIEQLVISFSPEYLVEMGLVPETLSVLDKGDYKHQYDDIRIRHAVSAGVHAMLENDGYYNGAMVAAIQSDTRHLHVHAVVYEDGNKFTRIYRGREERGMLKDSSLSRLAHHTHRHLVTTKSRSVIPTERALLMGKWEPDDMQSVTPLPPADFSKINWYLELFEELEQKDLEQKELEHAQASSPADDVSETLSL